MTRKNKRLLTNIQKLNVCRNEIISLASQLDDLNHDACDIVDNCGEDDFDKCFDAFLDELELQSGTIQTIISNAKKTEETQEE